MTGETLYPREGEVADADIAAFVAAILSAYPNKDFLYIRLADKWSVRVEDDVTALDLPGKLIVRRIVDYARSEGRLLDLLGLAWSDKPGNLQLAALAQAWLIDPDGVMAKYGAPPRPPPAGVEPLRPSLQKLVNASSRLINLGDFERGLQQLAGTLCRVCIPHVNGTGFLIGRRTVLTNYHVVEPAIQAGTQGGQIVCEFDFAEPTSVPVRRAALAGAGWLGPKSSYSLSDLTGTGEPRPDELDFAVIRLAEPVEPERPALELPFSPPLVTVRDYVMIGQHPKGEEAQIAFGQVIENPAGGLRYRYDVTTESGSSGSPVLDFSLRLVALHHAADPAGTPRYNQGVPIARIKHAVQDAGLDLEQL